MTESVPPSLKRFIWDIQSMVELTDDAREILLIGSDLMARLIATDDWLPEVFAAASPHEPRQFQLYSDGLERFCVVSTVLCAGQTLPVLQEPFWEIMGVLSGAVTLRKLGLPADGEARKTGDRREFGAGAVERLSPRSGEAFQLSNATDQVSICIHAYGGEIGACRRYAVTPEGRLEAQASGYANGEDDPPYDIWSIQTKIED